MRAWRIVCALALLLSPVPAAGDLAKGSGHQVLIETKFVQASRNDVGGLAFDWTGAEPTVQPLAPPIFDDLPVVGRLFAGERGKVLADPRTTTLSNQQAVLFVGGDLNVGGRAYPALGIGLTFVPRVTEDLEIKLDLQLDVDQYGVAGGMPSISSRTVRSSLILDSGQTAVIGGIFTDRTRETANRVPWLADLPILGLLFRDPGFGKAEQELLIFITPRIVGGGKPGRPPVHRPQVDPHVRSPQTPQYPQQKQTSPGYVR